LGGDAGFASGLLGRHALGRKGHADLLRAGLELLHLALEVADPLVLGRGLGDRRSGAVPPALLDVGAEPLDLALHLLDRAALLPHPAAWPAVLPEQVPARRAPGEPGGECRGPRL